MCGIFGLAGYNSTLSEKLFKKVLSKLFLLSESRGKEASGFANIFSESIEIFKSPFPAKVLVESSFFSQYFASTEKSQSIIGHSRLVTDGYEHDNDNNQPVIRDGYVLVHNGIVINHKQLWNEEKYGKKQTDLDTEIIPAFLKECRDKGLNIAQSLSMLFKSLDGMTSVAITDDSSDSLVLATNNGSLYYAYDSKSQRFVFASERHILIKLFKKYGSVLSLQTDSINQLLPNQNLIYDLKKKQFKIENLLISTDLTSNEIRLRRKIIKDVTVPLRGSKYINTSLEHHEVNVSRDLIDTYKFRKEVIKEIRRCTKCILPETFPYITFDESGVCNYCRDYKKIEYKGRDQLERSLTGYKKIAGYYDCLLPFSGGRDSSYVMHFVKNELGLRPLAYSYDWGMLTDLARRNQSRMCGRLGVEHILISADIRKKRDNIRKNVTAWLENPHLGMIPLFMAGDKQYFYHTYRLLKENNISLVIMGENPLEKTGFKTGFTGAKQDSSGYMAYNVSLLNKFRMFGFYFGQYLGNPGYLNSSLFDSITAAISYYIYPHNYENLFSYLTWDEKIVNSTLINIYDWETDPGTKTTWRIGDGTAAFYNYIYYMVAGFTENDTFRSNQIREGIITRCEALKLVETENNPRWDSLQWYCNTIKIDFEGTMKRVNQISMLF